MGVSSRGIFPDSRSSSEVGSAENVDVSGAEEKHVPGNWRLAVESVFILVK